MTHEYAAGAILFTTVNGTIVYILVEESDGHIGFPKGHLEVGETDEICALREIWEETGIKATLIDGFKEPVAYPKANDIMKHVTYFIATYFDQTPVHKVDEVNVIYVLPYEAALKKLTYDNAKRWLEKANTFVNKYIKLHKDQQT